VFVYLFAVMLVFGLATLAMTLKFGHGQKFKGRIFAD